MDGKALGQFIRARRLKRGLSQEALANLVDDSIRQTDISRLESGYVALPRQERLVRLAAALQVQPGVLLSLST
jgi:transcriptional regulator with XRE-family HTH domain